MCTIPPPVNTIPRGGEFVSSTHTAAVPVTDIDIKDIVTDKH